MAKSAEHQAALERLLAADTLDVAAALFAATFASGGNGLHQFRHVRNDLAKLTGVKGTGVLGGVNGPEYGIAVECALLWERALLAARTWAGDSSSMHVHLLRRGEAVLATADPYAAAIAALRNSG